MKVSHTKEQPKVWKFNKRGRVKNGKRYLDCNGKKTVLADKEDSWMKERRK
jgi:hypothetical protein